MTGDRAMTRLGAGLTGFLVMLAIIFVSPAAAATTTPFEASFRGTFTLTFFTGPGGTHELRLHGSGLARRLGAAEIEGYSTLRPAIDDPACNEIVDDVVSVTAADGSTLALVNEAVDCLEITPDGRILIHGRGTYGIVGGTGHLSGVGGSGSVSTEAEVIGLIPGGVSGTFDPLAFRGTLAR